MAAEFEAPVGAPNVIKRISWPTSVFETDVVCACPYVHQLIDGAYRVISNVNSYTVTASREGTSQSVPRDTQDHPCHIFVDDKRIVNRSLVDSELTARLVWTIKRDGEQVLQRNAKSETQFRYSGRIPGRYEVSVQKIVDGEYRTISNVLSYELPR